MNNLGRIIGDYQLIEKLENKKIKIKCLVCGNEKECSYENFISITNKHSNNCGKFFYVLEYENKIINNFKILKYLGPKRDSHNFLVECCECNLQREILLYNFSNLHHTSCESLRITRLNDGTEEFKKFRSIWYGIKSRMKPTTPLSYSNYGGRGIQNKFQDFTQFYNQCYETFLYYYPKFECISIERIDVNGDYEISNITWIEFVDQMKNRRTNKWFEAFSPDGVVYKSKNQKEFAQIHNLSQHCINHCLLGKNKKHKGWTFKFISEENDKNV